MILNINDYYIYLYIFDILNSFGIKANHTTALFSFILIFACTLLFTSICHASHNESFLQLTDIYSFIYIYSTPNQEGKEQTNAQTKEEKKL